MYPKHIRQKLQQVKNKHRKAFTLAEVLVTLAIIGVLAAVVIPGLLNSYQEKQFKIQAKKKFTELSQITLKLQAENNGTLVGLFVDPANDNTVRDKYLQHMRGIKKTCNAGGSTECWHSEWKWLNGNSFTDSLGYTSRAVLNDGTLLAFDYIDSNCLPHRCAYIIIDVNGFKGPNTVGKDIFFMSIVRERGLVPHSYTCPVSGDLTTSSCVSTGEGRGCIKQVLANEDY